MITIEEFGRRLRARELTSVRVTEECLQRIEADNRRLNAFIAVTADEALRAGARGRPRVWRPATIAVRCTASRSRSRICSTFAA
jgi:Asp-tRNAAsn/Glu-tRNAGln amidotransferase A subunit and related amidases